MTNNAHDAHVEHALAQSEQREGEWDTLTRLAVATARDLAHTLEFYGDAANYHRGDNYTAPRVLADGGRRARETLEAKGGLLQYSENEWQRVCEESARRSLRRREQDKRQSHIPWLRNDSHIRLLVAWVAVAFTVCLGLIIWAIV